jgi:hypothetical protein
MRLASEEAERLAKMSDDEFEEAMKALPEPGAASVGSAARGRTRAGWVVWAVAACVGALLIAALVGRREVVAWWRGGEIAPDREQAPRQQEPPAGNARGKELRVAGFAACERAEWFECVSKLDEAKAIDPAGDADPQVQDARRQATQGIRQQERQEKEEKEKDPKGGGR